MGQTEKRESAVDGFSAAGVAAGAPLSFQQAMLDAIPAHVAHVDASGHIVAINRAWEIFGKENPGSLTSVAPGADYLAVCEQVTADSVSASSAAMLTLREVLAGTRDSASFVYACHSDTEQRWYRVHFAPLRADGQRGALATHFNVTQEVMAEQKLFELAHFDALTGLPNRLLVVDRLHNSMALALRRNLGVAVLLVDIDRFNAINDTLGHSAGDRLLLGLSQRLVGCLRKSDTTGRLVGDAFAVIMPELENGNQAATLARRLLSLLEQPFEIDGQRIFVTVSIGIALYPHDADSAEKLIHCANTALQRAKEAGRNCFHLYTESMNRGALERLQLNTDLYQAQAQGEFDLYYQPQVSCLNGEIVGAEALLRWNHPVRGLVFPADFIPALEETGLIDSVGRWALKEACCQLKRWIDGGLGTPSVAVNISAHQFKRNNLLEVVREALALSGLPADRLVLELTEGVLMLHVERVLATMSELRQLGVRFAVDDFGTGYSSLSYLKRFPLDAIKVDRSFVQDITADPDDASITRAVITMAHSLKLKVIAEGVETEGQLSLLVANRCDEIQGYFFSHPVPAAQMEKMLADRFSIPALPALPVKRQRTILLVDDEENILASLRRLLRRDGYRILTANGGQAGLELLAQNEVDVILSDQRMPSMTGVEFLRRVKTIHPQTVRMVLSGYTELKSITDAINEGAIYKFLTKPWEDDLLRANIEEAFRYKELADENRRLSSEIQVANKELVQANTRLVTTLAEKERRIERDETTLDVAQEVLQCIPFPLLGFDNDDMVVFANVEANQLLGGGHLVGLDVGSCLPAELVALIRGRDGDSVDWQGGGKSWLARYRCLGRQRASSGRLLILFPSC